MKKPLNHKPIPGSVSKRSRGFLFFVGKGHLNNLLQQPYLILNIFFILIIAGVFLYAFIFPPSTIYPIQSLAGTQLSSTGLSRALSAAVRCNFADALRYNAYVFQVLGFFLLQLFLRIIFSWFWIVSQVNKNTLVIVDIILSVLLFLCGFGQMVINQLTR